MPDPMRELHAIAREYRTARRRLSRLVRRPFIPLEDIMSALEDLKSLEPRMDAIITAIGNDTATAVANAVAPLNQQISDMQAKAATDESDLAAEVGNMTTKVAALETAVGISAPAPAAPAEPAAQ